VDYRIRGFTRDVDGKKHYTDHDVSSIQDYLTEDTRAAYQMMDVNVYQDNLFHTKMILREFNLDNYVFGVNASDLDPQEADDIHQRLQKEMLDLLLAQSSLTPATAYPSSLIRPGDGKPRSRGQCVTTQR